MRCHHADAEPHLSQASRRSASFTRSSFTASRSTAGQSCRWIGGFRSLRSISSGVSPGPSTTCWPIFSAPGAGWRDCAGVSAFMLPSRRDFGSTNARCCIRIKSEVTSLRLDLRFGVHPLSRGQPRHRRRREAGARRAGSLPAVCTLLSHAFTPAECRGMAHVWLLGCAGQRARIPAYFPYSKHIHIFMAPAKYLVSREVMSGVLPAMVSTWKQRSRSWARASWKTWRGRGCWMLMPASSAIAARMSAPRRRPASRSVRRRSRSTSGWS
jgi:hypothetical protein